MSYTRWFSTGILTPTVIKDLWINIVIGPLFGRRKMTTEYINNIIKRAGVYLRGSFYKFNEQDRVYLLYIC